MLVSDEKLMLDVQQGSAEAFTELFLRYRGPLYGFFRRRLENSARAEELAQETFAAILTGASRYEPRALFRTYLYGIAIHLLLADRRKSSRQPRAPDGAEADLPAHAEDPAAALWVRRAIAQLDPADREILLLREYEGLSYQEIAALLRLPLNTVRSRLFRARMALKALLVPRGPLEKPR